MKNELLYDNFIEEVRCRVPENEKISNVLADILLIEKEAVYRRLRREVPFTFSEIAAICTKMRISLDCIIESLPSTSRPCQFIINEFIEPDEVNYKMMENLLDLFSMNQVYNKNEIGMCCNILPQCIYLGYEHITKFIFFKWKSLYSKTKETRPMSKLVFTDRMKNIQEEHHRAYRRLDHLVMIWDKNILKNLITDVNYFSTIRLVPKEEKNLLKEDIKKLIDDMEILAEKGKFDSGTKVDFYISNINFDTTAVYAENEMYNLGMIKTFTLNTVTTVDDYAYETIKSNISTVKRVSTLISESGEQQRILFFDTQRELVETMM